MKTIILCGGKGTRLREETEFKPKPMVEIGGKPILLHILNIYAYYGYNEFILCLGYKSEMIKEFFLNLSAFTNDFAFDLSKGEINYIKNNMYYDFKIIFAETGEETLTSERIKMVLPYIKEDQFMVTYGDGVSNIDINNLIKFHNLQYRKYKTIGTIAGVHPSSKYGKIVCNKKNVIKIFNEKPVLNDYINGGFMIFESKAKRYFKEGEMLEDTLISMVKSSKISQYTHDGFWHSMDTMKDVIDLNRMWESDKPWAIWDDK